MSQKAVKPVKKGESKAKEPVASKAVSERSQAFEINSPFEHILYLQRTIGNRAVTRLIRSGFLQAKESKDNIAEIVPDVDSRVIRREISGGSPCQQPPTHITTMDEYIELVERAEAAYPGTSARNMITRIRKTKYSGFPWSSFVTAPASQGALTPTGVLTQADVQAFACDIMVSMPGGGSTDPSHIIVGLDVRRYPGGSVLVPSGVSAEAATTWAGDVGSAYSEYIAQNHPPSEASSATQTKENYWNEFSPYHDLMADVDGLAMSAPTTPQWNFDDTQPLSVNLRNFFSPAAGQGRHQRFTLFASAAGIQWTGRGSGLNIAAASRTGVIEQQIDLFVQGNLPTLAQFMLHNPGGGGLPGTSPGGGLGGGGLGGGGGIADLLYWREYNQRVQQRSWFIDRFVNFVQDGLRGENP